jgi:hypothetical protein
VEACTSVKNLKYLYICHVAAFAQLQREGTDGSFVYNEVQTSLDGRYVTAPEGMWRLNEFPISEN